MDESIKARFLYDLGIRKEQTDYIVTKEFQDEELFRGNSEALKGYFRSLFDSRSNSDDVIQSRLNSLRSVMGFAGQEYKDMLESILPQLKPNSDLGER